MKTTTGFLTGVFTVLIVLSLIAVTGKARAEVYRFDRVIPDGATIEYRVNGALVQAMPIKAGAYTVRMEITPRGERPPISLRRPSVQK